jgi:uncharacterized RDD family membrane protein YckC
MRKIDITTSQNVTINYELASVIERAVSTLIDMIIIILGSLILTGIIKIFLESTVPFNFGYVYIPGSFLYHLLLETFNHGQTIGKLIFKIRVVKITGERPGFFDFFMRCAFRLIDITTTFGTLALITISSSEKGQRLGDYLADTTVVKLINFNKFSLERILSLDKLKDYTPTYPNVTMFKEEEMLLVKETLDRYVKFPNERHTHAFHLLVKKIEEQLGIVAPQNKTQFLNTLIKDYVSLTR